MTPRVVIVDNHSLIRLAVKIVLEQDGCEVVAECHTGTDGVQAVRTHKPDLVILDLGISNLDGFSVIERLHSIQPAIRILVLASGDSRHYATRCLQAGTSGFVSKDDKPDELSRAVAVVLAGRTYFPIAALEKGCKSPASELDQLTDREMTVLQLLVKGMNNVEIGRTLLLSHKTVSTHKVSLMSKLNAPNMVELVKVAQRSGIVTA